MKTKINNHRIQIPCWLRAICIILLCFASSQANSQTCVSPFPGNTISSVNTACAGTPFTLSIQNPVPGTGVSYLWESADDSDFTINVIPLGSSILQTVISNTPQYYRCQVTCVNGPLTAFTTPVFVDVYDPLIVAAAGIDLTCHGDNYGEVYLSISGGTSPYSYDWNSGLYNTANLTNLAAGTYSVVVTDINGCQATTSSTLTEPTVLDLTSVVTNVSMMGALDGSIQLNATGGTPPYEYSIDGGSTWSASNTFSNLSATLYHCRVRDANSCVTTLDVTINFPSPIFVDPNILINISSNIDSVAHIVWGVPTSLPFPVSFVTLERSDDGVNFVPIAGGLISNIVNVMNMPPTFVVPNGSIFKSTEQQVRFLFNEIVPNLSPSTTVFYRAKFSDGSGAQSIYTSIKQFLPPPIAIQPWPNLNPMPCPPVGFPPIGFTPTTWQVSQQIGCCFVTKRLYVKYNCLTAGTCADCLPACGCTSDPCCVHNCGQYASCTCTPWPSCGTGPTIYMWVVTGSVYTAPLINTTQTNVSCNGGANGSITILGGLSFCKRNKIIGAPPCFTATHTMPWPNAIGQISNVFSGLCAGCYTIMVKDCNGCTSTKVVCITQPTPINLTATVVNSCLCTGKIIVNATGGTPCTAGGYTYQILPTGIPQSSNVFNNLCVGCYTIKVTDCNGCTKTIVKCVTTTSFNLQPVLVDPCLGNNNGSICINGLATTSANSCLKYSIGSNCTPPATAVYTTNPCFTNLPAGNYCIKIKDTCTNCDTCICVTLTNSNIPCGKTNSLIVNTGYDPVTGTKIIPNGIVDPKWTVTAVGGAVFGPVLTSAHPAWAVNANSHAIGFAGGDQTGTRIYRRTFKMCGCDSITFNLNLAYDNWLNGIYIDGVLINIPSTITPVAQRGWTSNFTTFHNFTFKRYLCDGTHTIDIRVVNLGGPSGLNLFGSVTGTNNSLVTNVSPVNCCCACTIFNVTPVVTNVGCSTSSTGSVCIASPAGTNTSCWKYRIGTSCTNLSAASQTNPCFTGLGAGNYCVKITDTCTGCDTCVCFTINQPIPFQLSATSVNTCSCNGSITVNVSGGSPCPISTYTYQILPSGLVQSSNTFNNLCPGCYTIIVTDCNGCTSSIVKCVTALSGPTGLNAVVTNPLCNGGTGSICINNSVGTINPCLKYALVGTNCQLTAASVLQTNPCFTGLVAGSYCVKIKDTCTGCDTCICVTITQPSPITLTATSVNTCSCNGSITVNASGGTPCTFGTGYSYQIFPGGTIQASPTFNGLCPGCYTIVVKDCNQCTSSIVKCVIGVGGPTGLNAVVTNPLCNGGTGSICINNAVGTTNPCLKYALVGTNCQLTAASVLQTNPCFTGLPAGNYCVMVKDTCTGCDTCICVTISQPSPITLTATSINTCSCNGSITVNATGGTPCIPGPGYSYQIFPGGTIQASPTFNGLCPGCYTIVVKDCNQCTSSIVKCVIGVGGPTGLNAVVTNPLCNGGTGTICINNAVGTTNPCLKYALVGTNCQLTTASVLQTNPCFTGLPAGNYCVKIKDTCTGCDTCICVTITQPSPITLTATSVNTCSCNGSITVNATGGTPCIPGPGYSYQIFPGGTIQASPTFNGLCPGCYTIVVKDCNQCTSSIVKCVIGIGGPTGLNAVVTNPLCNGGTGTICINNSVGTTNPCLKYALVGTNCQLTAASVLQNNPCFTGLPAGNYCVMVKDTCTGCDTCICVTITQPSPITLTATSVNTCSCNGSITVNATGGTPCTFGTGYSYQIFPGGTIQASPTFNGLCPGCYTIVVKDCNQCTSSIVKCVIGVGGPTGLNAVVTNPLCNGGTGTICINNAVGTTNPCLKYALVGTNCQLTAASVLQTNPCFTGLPAGNYCVMVKDTCTGCDTCICVTITQPSPITLTATSVNTCSCNGSITVNATGGTPCIPGPGYSYQIFPGGTIQASPTFNGLCPGCYTIVVKDCNQCTSSIVKCVIGVGGPTGLNAVVTNPLCNGGTGTICINNSTGTINPCLKYALVGTNCQLTTSTVLQTNPCFIGLAAGNYCVMVKDTCTGCDTCICVTITQPSPITLTATSVNTCSCNGSITVNATGGTPCIPGPGYSYQIFPGGTIQASPTFNGLCPGCYTIVVKDCNQCTSSIVKCVIGVGGPTGLNAVVTNPLCNGGTGTICINNSVGTTNPCLKYALVGTNCQLTAASVLQNNPCFTGLVAGSYCVKIKDTCTGCDTCICVTITQPPSMQLSATSVNTCSCNGSITVNASGGTPCTFGTGYSYQIFPGGTIQASPTFNGLCPGCYTIVVKDCNQCTSSIVKCVIGVGGPTGLNAVVTNPLCNGGTGTICINNAVGTTNPCLKYALVGTNCQLTAASVLQTNPCFTGLPAGNYCVMVKDTCTGCDTCICVTISQPSPITLTATSINTCLCNGSITVNATGGTPCIPGPGYSYQIFPGGTIQASPTFNGLCPGCYTIVVKDCNQCTSSIVKCVIGVGGPTGLNAVVTNPTCNGGTGTICINNSTGTINPCLKYALVNSNCQLTAASLLQTNPCFTGLPAGNYCVMVKDTCTGCDTCICVTITQPPSMQLSATSVNTCSCNGSITVNVSGGTPCPAGSYTYQILPSGLVQASNTFNNLCPGCYTIIVTDCNGCTASIVKCVTAVGSPTGLNAVVTNPTCNGGTGTICINNSTGTINPCLKYALVNSNCQLTAASLLQTNPCFTGLPAGNYCVMVKDTCTGCDTCICVTITQPPSMQLSATSVNTCSCNGSITVNVSGGTPCPAGSYTYQILPSGLVQASNTFNNLCPGCYTIIVTDCNGCTASIVKCVTAVGSPTGLNAVVTNPTCNGGTGTICINNSTGTINPCLKYALVNSNCQLTAASLLQTNPCFTGLPAGNYCVMVKDTCTGCDTCICVTITQPAPIMLTANSITVCPCNSSITVNAIGGTPCTFGTGYTYQIFPGGAIQASPTFNGLCAGCYTIVVKDCNQCTASIVKCVGPCGGGNPIIINLTAYLQGYYVGSGMMRPVLFNQGVSTNTNLTDQITVELTSSQFPYQLVASTTTDLMTNGQAIASFNAIPAGLYYVVLKHRNSIQTWSAGPLPLSPATTYNYDFTASQAQAYGNNMIEVEPGVWAIYTGDVNQDENIDLTDYTLYESDASNFLFGYLPTDIDGDGTVDLLDSPILENNLFNFIFSSHP